MGESPNIFKEVVLMKYTNTSIPTTTTLGYYETDTWDGILLNLKTDHEEEFILAPMARQKVAVFKEYVTRHGGISKAVIVSYDEDENAVLKPMLRMAFADGTPAAGIFTVEEAAAQLHRVPKARATKAEMAARKAKEVTSK